MSDFSEMSPLRIKHRNDGEYQNSTTPRGGSMRKNKFEFSIKSSNIKKDHKIEDKNNNIHRDVSKLRDKKKDKIEVAL